MAIAPAIYADSIHRSLKLKDERLTLLNRELKHRIKNLFAVTGSICVQTIKSDIPREDLAKAIIGRIQAAASAQDLISATTAEGSDLRALVEAIVKPVSPDLSRLEIDGPHAARQQWRSKLTVTGLILSFDNPHGPTSAGNVRPPTEEAAELRTLVADHRMLRSRSRAWRSMACVCRRSSMRSRVYRPCLSAFLFPLGAPDPGAPPCIRQRFLPLTAGELQGFPDRVFAPHRGLERIGPVLRG